MPIWLLNSKEPVLDSQATLVIQYDGKSEPLPADVYFEKASIQRRAPTRLGYGLTCSFEGSGFPSVTHIREDNNSLGILKNAAHIRTTQRILLSYYHSGLLRNPQ